MPQRPRHGTGQAAANATIRARLEPEGPSGPGSSSTPSSTSPVEWPSSAEARSPMSRPG
jgi:hypothetical protein